MILLGNYCFLFSLMSYSFVEFVELLNIRGALDSSVALGPILEDSIFLLSKFVGLVVLICSAVIVDLFVAFAGAETSEGSGKTKPLG